MKAKLISEDLDNFVRGQEPKEVLGLGAKKLYIFYSVNTMPKGHIGHDDVAITEAKSLKEAITNFKEYYGDLASAKTVQLINCHREGYIDNMMIISDY